MMLAKQEHKEVIKMKNREFRTLVAAVMLTTLVAGSVGTTPAYVFAAEGNAKVSTEQKDAKTEKYR